MDAVKAEVEAVKMRVEKAVQVAVKVSSLPEKNNSLVHVQENDDKVREAVQEAVAQLSGLDSRMGPTSGSESDKVTSSANTW